MSKPKPKRTKRYVQREQLVDPVSWAVAGAHKLPTATVAATMAAITPALKLLKQGRATRNDWNVVCQAVNVAEALAGLQVGHNLLSEIKAGEAALLAVALRMIEGRATCYAIELAAIDEALFVYEAQLKVCTQSDIGKAIARVKELFRSGAMDNVVAIFDRMVDHETRKAA